MDHVRPSTGGGPVNGSAAREAQSGDGARAPARRRFRPPALLARFPKLFWRRSAEQPWPDDLPVVRPAHLTDYPALADDLKVWLDQVEPRFRELDHQARILQNQFWRQHLALIIGGLVATSLGAVQAALGGGVTELAVAQALLTGVLAGLTVLIRSRRVQQGYFTTRLRAERIKSEFFLFLARVGTYAADDPVAKLRQQIDDIEAAGGAA
jgi:hypothetical protein